MLTASSDFSSPGYGARAKRAAARTGLAVDPHSAAFIAEGDEPRWGRFLKAWQDLAAEHGRVPTRSEIDPARIGADLLPNVFLVDVVRAANGGKPRFRFRLLGQTIRERETTRPGDFLDQIGTAADTAEMERQYLAAVDGEIWIRNANLIWNDAHQEVFTYQVMALPIADQAGEIAHLIGLALYSF